MNTPIVIENKGITRTSFINNNKRDNNTLVWDLNYDGNIANLDLDVENNGEIKHYNYQLDNADLENILNIQPVNIPLEQQLMNDYYLNSRNKPANYNNYNSRENMNYIIQRPKTVRRLICKYKNEKPKTKKRKPRTKKIQISEIKKHTTSHKNSHKTTINNKSKHSTKSKHPTSSKHYTNIIKAPTPKTLRVHLTDINK
jgi:hypothetical protein